MEDVVRHADMSTTNFNFVKKASHPVMVDQGGFSKKFEELSIGLLKSQIENIPTEYIFSGYPDGNFLKIVCVVLSLWNQAGKFPISFLEIESLMQHDNTY